MASTPSTSWLRNAAPRPAPPRRRRARLASPDRACAAGPHVDTVLRLVQSALLARTRPVAQALRPVVAGVVDGEADRSTSRVGAPGGRRGFRGAVAAASRGRATRPRGRASRITGMRSCRVAIGRVGARREDRAGPQRALRRSPCQIDHRPANANGSWSSRVMWNGCLGRAGGASPLVEAVGDDQAAVALEGAAEGRLLGGRLHAGIDHLRADRGVLAQTARAPSAAARPRGSLLVGRDGQHLIGWRDIEALADLDRLADREAGPDRLVGRV